MFDGIRLSREFVWRKLPNDSVVVYSPEGFARPFVVTGSALYIFSCIQNNIQIDTKIITKDSVIKILNVFEKEKIISGWKNSVKETTERITNKTTKGKRISLWIHTTDLCNLRCKGCYIIKGKSVISNKTIRYIKNYVRWEAEKNNLKILNLKFSGGEPLIAFGQVEKTVKEIKEALKPFSVRLNLSIISNGTLITKAIAKKLKELNFRVMISLNGIGNFNNTRPYIDGTSSYDDTIKGIEELLSINIKPHIIAVITNESVRGLRLLTDFVVKKDLSLSLSFSRDLDRNNKLQLNATKVPRLVIEELKRITEKSWAKTPKISFNNLSFNGKKERVCAAGKSYFAIGTSGSVSTCQMTIEEPFSSLDSNIGGIKNTNIEKSVFPEDCMRCTWKYVCAGGCQAIAKKTDGIGKTPLLCRIHRQILPLLLVYEGTVIQEAMAKKERRMT